MKEDIPPSQLKTKGVPLIFLSSIKKIYTKSQYKFIKLEKKRGFVFGEGDPSIRVKTQRINFEKSPKN